MKLLPTDRRYLQNTFADVPLETRRQAWKIWMELPREGDERYYTVVQGPSAFNGKEGKCSVCPWGAVLLAEAREHPAVDLYLQILDMGIFLRPQIEAIKMITSKITKDGWSISPANEGAVVEFVGIFDDCTIDDSDLFLLLLPEDVP